MKYEFYGESLAESMILNPMTYRGKGRPRKTDYMSLKEAIKKYNKQLNQYLDLRIRQIWPPLNIK